MKKCLQTLIISFLLILVMPMAKLSAQVSTWDGTWEPWTHGTGTEVDPFLIENAQQLAYLAYRVNNGLDAGGGHVSNHDYHYKLMVDVDLNGSEDFQWTPIGYWNSDTDYQCFGGHFDGNKHIISGLYIDSSIDKVGLFGSTCDASFKGITMNGIRVSTTGSHAGGIIGYANGCITIDNCHTNFTDGVYGKHMVGGILGCFEGSSPDARIHNCYNNAKVALMYTYYDQNATAGGIVGYAPYITISYCYNTGDIESSNVDDCYCYLGGIMGRNYHYLDDNRHTIISNCYNTGDIMMYHEIYGSHGNCGGILGGIYYDGFYLYGPFSVTNYTEINNCYNTGSIIAYVMGAILGSIDYLYYELSNCYSTTVNDCYYLASCGGNNVNGGQPLSADAMQSEEFVDMINNGSCVWNYDYDNVNSGYPVFSGIMVALSVLDPTNVTQSQATLHGTIQVENDSVIEKWFEYRPSAYGVYSMDASGNENVSATVYLEPDKEYTCKLGCRTMNCGTVYSEEKTFSTKNTTVITYPATNLAENSATLNGFINAGDAPIWLKGFKYWPANDSQNYTMVYDTISSSNNISVTLNDLMENTVYEYRACMFLPSGAGRWGDIKSFELSWLNFDTICVSNVDKLRWVAEQCNNGTTFEGKCIMLTNDITLPLNVPNNMVSIGSYPDHPFKGTFDGNGKLIYNLYIDQPNTPYQGFFGYTLNANLYNVGLVNITASGRNYTGGMVAYAKNTHMRDCYVNGGTLFALSYCGGLVGYQEQGTNSIISGCYNTCEVTGNNYVGGLVGFSNYSTVRNSYVAAPVSGQGNGIGAIIGGANEVLMYYCYFSTEITGQTEAIGENNFKGGEGLSNAQMRDPQFVSTLNQGLVTPVWMADYTTHINNGFPIIKWQRPGTSIDEINVAKNCISLYPNPTHDFVTIQSDDPSVSLQHAEVYDVNGRQVMSEVLDGQQKELSVAKLLSGVYYIRIQTNNGYCTNLKLVVQ